jgi:hypothetical protein
MALEGSCAPRGSSRRFSCGCCSPSLFLWWPLPSSGTLPPSRRQEVSRQEAKYQSVNDAKFRSLFDAGANAIKEAQYGAALDNFQEAERSTDQLTLDQYASLKNSRQQIASLCDASGRSSEAEGAYKALAASAIQQGQILWRGKHCDAALGEFGDAERFSKHLTETKQASLLQSRNSLVGCLEELHRYPAAVETTQRMIDYLRTSADAYDPALTAQYMNLARTYSLENDWKAAEQATLLASESCDNTISHFGHDTGSDAEQLVGGAISQKGVAQYWLVIAYWHEGNTDLALSTADDYFNYKLEPGGRWGTVRLSPQKEVANLALQIATEANRQDAIDLWRQRLNNMH